MNKSCGIYCIKNENNGMLYIGKSNDISNRFYKHLRKLRKNIHDNKHMQNVFNKHGENIFSFHIIKNCFEEELNEKEIYYIKKFKTKTPNGYNMTDGGDGTTGRKHTDETKEKLSKIRGEKASMYGKKHTSEAKKKMSDAQLGDKNHNFGKHHSENSKNKISEATKGNNNPMSGVKFENSSSKYMGVSFGNRNKRFIARINKDGKRIYIGSFENEIEAARAYDKKCYELYGDKAKLNFPEDYGL